jgi:hypothetical protein
MQHDRSKSGTIRCFDGIVSAVVVVDVVVVVVDAAVVVDIVM